MIQIKNTKDQSKTIYSELFDEHYHSVHGAYSESMHVFINAGFNSCHLKNINIFEVGFGTGLNAALTFLESIKKEIQVEYTAIELYPIDKDTIDKLNYNTIIPAKYYSTFIKMHESPWNQKIKLANNFSLLKVKGDLNEYNLKNNYSLVYFDAFAPEKQPEMWSVDNFSKIYNALNANGILTTYSSKGMVKNNLRNAGFTVKRLPGPEGKRHILRATKVI